MPVHPGLLALILPLLCLAGHHCSVRFWLMTAIYSPIELIPLMLLHFGTGTTTRLRKFVRRSRDKDKCTRRFRLILPRLSCNSLSVSGSRQWIHILIRYCPGPLASSVTILKSVWPSFNIKYVPKRIAWVVVVVLCNAKDTTEDGKTRSRFAVPVYSI